jgi:hypothetical protein
MTLSTHTTSPHPALPYPIYKLGPMNFNQPLHPQRIQYGKMNDTNWTKSNTWQLWYLVSDTVVMKPYTLALARYFQLPTSETNLEGGESLLFKYNRRNVYSPLKQHEY